jgi:ribonuclease P protein component
VIEAAPPSQTLKIERLTKRPQFLAAAQGRSVARGAVVIQALRQEGTELARAGFTATRKIGGAVERNRAKRRLRHAAQSLLPLHGQPGFDYVFIARGGTVSRPWLRLLDDVKSALISLSAPTRLDGDRAPAPSSR